MLNRNIMGAMRMLQMKDEAGAAEGEASPGASARVGTAPWQGEPDPLFAAAKDEPNAWEAYARHGAGRAEDAPGR